MRRVFGIFMLILLTAALLPTAAYAEQIDVYSAIMEQGSVRLEKNGVTMRGGSFCIKNGAPVGLSAKSGKAALYITQPNGRPLRILFGNIKGGAFDIRGSADRIVIFEPFQTDYELEFSEDSAFNSVVLQSGVDVNYFGRVNRFTVFSGSEVDLADTAYAKNIFLRSERSKIRVDATAHVDTLHCVSRAQTAVVYDLDARS